VKRAWDSAKRRFNQEQVVNANVAILPNTSPVASLANETKTFLSFMEVWGSRRS